MKCNNCRVKISVHISVRTLSGKMVGPYCERCAELVASGQVKTTETNNKKAA